MRNLKLFILFLRHSLGDDFASFTGTEGNLGDGAFRFTGYVRVEAAGPQTFTTTSDDGSVVYINDELVVSNDNGHGNHTVSGTVDFPAAGYYPIDIRYFNGDWTNEAGDHGGANFIGEAGFDSVVQGLEGVPPSWTPVRASPAVDVLFLGANDAPDAGADAEVAAFLEATFGSIRYLNSSNATGEETADVIVMSSTFGSGSVRGKFHNSSVPIVNWEEAIMDANTAGELGQSVAVMTKSTDTTQMALGNHPIAGDLAGTTIDFLSVAGDETLDSGELSAGTVAVGTAVGGAIDGMAMLFVTDTGGVVAEGAGVDGNVSPARRVAFPMTDITFNNVTDAGRELLINSILWAAGQLEEPGPDNDLAVGLLAYYALDGHLEDGVGDSHGVGKIWLAGGKQDQPELLADHPAAALSYADGAFGQGVDLDGAGQYIETPLENEESFDFGAPDNPTGFTVSAWFRVDGFTKGWQALIAKGEQNQWHVHRQGSTDNLVGNGGNADIGQDLESVNDGQIHHIALVSDPANGNVRLYIDGVLREEGAAPALENNPMPMMIGQNPDTDDRTWDGLIDDVALWSRPLTEAEVVMIAGSEVSLGELASVPPVGGGGGGGERPFDLLDARLNANGAFTVTLLDGVTADIEYSTDLVEWEVIATGLSGVLEETDAARLAAPEGYYRAR